MSNIVKRGVAPMNIGIIGAGSISKYHINSYKQVEGCCVKAIADLNLAQAQSVADECGITDVYSDYKEMLADEAIDAVSIVTPTFTHKNIVLDAIKAKKHILCEKPPALNADEVKECAEAARDYGKCFMFGFVCRFGSSVQYMKKYIESGKMGKVICADGARITALSRWYGWFNSKKKGGGVLIDAAIHELDLMMYLMGYPKPKAVLAAQDGSNAGLLNRVKSPIGGWKSADTGSYERDVEDVIKGFVTFENGASLTISASSILRTVEERRYVEINGDTAGARFFANGKTLEITEINDEDLSVTYEPEIEPNDGFLDEIKHFIDCCEGRAECICRAEEAIRLMEVIDAIYKSAETGMPVIM